MSRLRSKTSAGAWSKSVSKSLSSADIYARFALLKLADLAVAAITSHSLPRPPWPTEGGFIAFVVKTSDTYSSPAELGRKTDARSLSSDTTLIVVLGMICPN